MGWNILVVDDSVAMRSMLKKIILNSGLPVTRFHEASNGQEGLTVLKVQEVDLLLVDLNMPVMNGLEMITQVRARPEYAALPIIVVSTEASRTRIAEIQARGVHFIHKPFTPAQIRETIQKCRENTPRSSPQQILREVGREVFESLAGMTVRPEEEAGEEKLQVRAVVLFSGPFSGGVMVDVPESLLLLLANNMLGLELGFPSANRQGDSLCELANVICANVLARLAGSDPVFDLGAPKILPASGGNEALPPGRRQTSVSLRLEEGWAKLTLMVDQAVPEKANH